MQRCMYAIPDSSIFPSNKLVEMEIKAKESKDPTAFRASLQVNLHTHSYDNINCHSNAHILFSFCNVLSPAGDGIGIKG